MCLIEKQGLKLREEEERARGHNVGTDTDKQRILDIIANITPLDSVAMEQARARQQVLTKPADSLGRLEDLAVQIAGISHHFLT